MRPTLELPLVLLYGLYRSSNTSTVPSPKVSMPNNQSLLFETELGSALDLRAEKLFGVLQVGYLTCTVLVGA